MRLSLEIICYMVPGVQVINAQSVSAAAYDRLMLFDPSRQEFKQDVIYIGKAEEIQEKGPALLQGITLFLAGESRLLESLMRDKNWNESILLVLPTANSISDAYECLQNAFFTLNQWESELSLSVYRDEDIGCLFQVGKELLKSPIVIWDSSFQFIFTANFDERVDINPVLQEARKLGRWPGEIIGRLLSETNYLSEAMLYTKLFMVAPPCITNCYCATKNFVIKNKVVMTIETFFLEGRPSSGELELLEVFIDQIQECLKRNPMLYMGHKKVYEEFILELLEGKLTKDEEIQERLKYINFDYRGTFELFVLEGRRGEINAVSGFAKSFCKQIFPFSKIVEYKGRLVGLNLRAENKNTAAFTGKNEFETDFRSQFFVMGVSGTYHCMKDTRKALVQAERALKCGTLLMPEKRFYHFRDYYVHSMIYDNLLNYGERFFGCITEPLQMLREADEKKQTNQEELLKTWLLNGRNTARTAQIMNMHKNTVIYRMKQIERKLELDLEDEDTIFQLMLGMKIVELRDAMEKQQKNVKTGEEYE